MKYFTFEELMHSNVALQNGVDNLPPREERAKIYFNLVVLVDNLLDPIRERFAAPMIITSGYRCKQLNELVKGVENSQHMEGKAADFYFAGFTTKEMAQAFFEIAESYNFDQLIFYKKSHFIHISYNSTKNRHEAFIR